METRKKEVSTHICLGFTGLLRSSGRLLLSGGVRISHSSSFRRCCSFVMMRFGTCCWSNSNVRQRFFTGHGITFKAAQWWILLRERKKRINSAAQGVTKSYSQPFQSWRMHWRKLIWNKWLLPNSRWANAFYICFRWWRRVKFTSTWVEDIRPDQLFVYQKNQLLSEW